MRPLLAREPISQTDSSPASDRPNARSFLKGLRASPEIRRRNAFHFAGRRIGVTSGCSRCASQSPHPTLWPGKVLAMYECPKCGQPRECAENVEAECVDINPDLIRPVGTSSAPCGCATLRCTKNKSARSGSVLLYQRRGAGLCPCGLLGWAVPVTGCPLLGRDRPFLHVIAPEFRTKLV
jgi:hypothetical protein